MYVYSTLTEQHNALQSKYVVYQSRSHHKIVFLKIVHQQIIIIIIIMIIIITNIIMYHYWREQQSKAIHLG